VRGASAVQELLEELPDADMRVLVVWEPVLWSDLAPPLSAVLSQIPDLRAIQSWDPHRTLSEEIVRAVSGRETELPCVGSISADTIVWDVVAIFPPGVRWDARPPAPAYCGYPVLYEIDQLRTQLASMAGHVPPVGR
jgi:hypothetical protein